MKILFLPSNYPYLGYPFAGAFNEHCATALKKLGHYVEVFLPRPYVPSLFKKKSKWKGYSTISTLETKNGISIHRPVSIRIPKIGAVFWSDLGLYIFRRQYAKKLHYQSKFDVILSINLYNTGGFAWRLGRYLAIPACGWASGDEVRVSSSTSFGKSVIRTVENLDLVFYQSNELLDVTAKLTNKKLKDLIPKKHIVLSRGIPLPQNLNLEKNREKCRLKWGIPDKNLVALYFGRISKEKGMFELIEAISVASQQNKNLSCVIVGRVPDFDDSKIITEKIQNTPNLKNIINIYSACRPDEKWEILSGADIFVFPSYNEGMPNSLLEAMAVGIPAVAFDIPAIKELDGGSGSLIQVPSYDAKKLGDAIIKLSLSAEERINISMKSKNHVKENFDIMKNMERVINAIKANKLL